MHVQPNTFAELGFGTFCFRSVLLSAQRIHPATLHGIFDGHIEIPACPRNQKTGSLFTVAVILLGED
jgi:hypothetical protein